MSLLAAIITVPIKWLSMFIAVCAVFSILEPVTTIMGVTTTTALLLVVAIPASLVISFLVIFAVVVLRLVASREAGSAARAWCG